MASSSTLMPKSCGRKAGLTSRQEYMRRASRSGTLSATTAVKSRESSSEAARLLPRSSQEPATEKEKDGMLATESSLSVLVCATLCAMTPKPYESIASQFRIVSRRATSGLM